jgi:CheY-like chemotaxis protein
MLAKKLLIIGDDLVDLHRTFDVALEGHRLVYAAGMSEATERLAEHADVEIIFVDVSTEKLHGLDVLARIRVRHGSVPLVVVGADALLARTLSMIGGVGTIHHIPKPARRVDIQAAVHGATAAAPRRAGL